MKLRLALLILLLAPGCAAAPVAKFDHKASSKGSASFAREIIDKQEMTFHEGLRGVIIFSEGRRQDMSYKACVLHASKQEIVPGHWAVKYSENSPLTRGMLAFMLVKVLGIQGGLAMRIMEATPRYALRECQHLEIIEKGSEYSPVSGREFLSILRNAEEYARKNIPEG